MDPQVAVNVNVIWRIKNLPQGVKKSVAQVDIKRRIRQSLVINSMMIRYLKMEARGS